MPLPPTPMLLASVASAQRIKHVFCVAQPVVWVNSLVSSLGIQPAKAVLHETFVAGHCQLRGQR